MKSNFVPILLVGILALSGCSSAPTASETKEPVGPTQVTTAPSDSSSPVETATEEPANQTEPQKVVDESSDPEEPQESSAPKASETKTSAPKPSVSKTPSPTPAPTKTEAVASGYTAAQVAEKNSRSNCWVILNDSVYNLTDWITKHPGGSGSILSLCGSDATSAFEGKHGGEARPSSILASYYLGPLNK